MKGIRPSMRLKLLKLKWWYKKKVHDCKAPKEIYEMMQKCHDAYLKADRENNKDVAMKKKAQRDALKWVLKING